MANFVEYYLFFAKVMVSSRMEQFDICKRVMTNREGLYQCKVIVEIHSDFSDVLHKPIYSPKKNSTLLYFSERQNVSCGIKSTKDYGDTAAERYFCRKCDKHSLSRASTFLFITTQVETFHAGGNSLHWIKNMQKKVLCQLLQNSRAVFLRNAKRDGVVFKTAIQPYVLEKMYVFWYKFQMGSKHNNPEKHTLVYSDKYCFTILVNCSSFSIHIWLQFSGGGTSYHAVLGLMEVRNQNFMFAFSRN